MVARLVSPPLQGCNACARSGRKLYNGDAWSGGRILRGTQKCAWQKDGETITRPTGTKGFSPKGTPTCIPSNGRVGERLHGAGFEIDPDILACRLVAPDAKRHQRVGGRI